MPLIAFWVKSQPFCAESSTRSMCPPNHGRYSLPTQSQRQHQARCKSGGLIAFSRDPGFHQESFFYFMKYFFLFSFLFLTLPPSKSGHETLLAFPLKAGGVQKSRLPCNAHGGVLAGLPSPHTQHFLSSLVS